MVFRTTSAGVNTMDTAYYMTNRALHSRVINSYRGGRFNIVFWVVGGYLLGLFVDMFVMFGLRSLFTILYSMYISGIYIIWLYSCYYIIISYSRSYTNIPAKTFFFLLKDTNLLMLRFFELVVFSSRIDFSMDHSQRLVVDACWCITIKNIVETLAVPFLQQAYGALLGYVWLLVNMVTCLRPLNSHQVSWFHSTTLTHSSFNSLIIQLN